MERPSAASAENPRALFLSPEAPYPLIGGGPLRTASLLEYLSRRYSVDIIVFQDNGAPDPLAAIPRGLAERAEVISLPRHSKHAMARAARNGIRLLRGRPPLLDRFSGFEKQIASFVSGQQYDLAVVEHFWCAPYIEQLRPHAKAAWLDLHNIESAWHLSLADVAPSPPHAAAHRRFARAYFEIERLLLPAFDALLVTSEQDAARARSIAPRIKTLLYPNALASVPAIDRHEDDAIAFSGNLEYEPNKAAIRFFKDSIWPMLRDRWPQLVWRIIGKNPQAVARLLAGDPRIHLAGPVNDAVAALARAKAAVVPLLAGSGTRIKILEAWAAATPVVSTSFGAEGLKCRAGGHLLLADTPGEFTDQVSKLLGSPQLRLQIGQAGWQLCQDHYTWTAAWTALEEALRKHRTSA
jgi:glycosyltransferase involved in cell wall biosynthesis